MQAIDRQPERALDGAPGHCDRHRQEQTTLYRLVHQHAATFCARAEDAAGADLPQFVKDEFDAFLECGILAHPLPYAHRGNRGTTTMADWLTGGVAAITGAGSGIGAALAQDLARRGMHLALSDRNQDAMEAVATLARADGVNVTTHVFDVTDRAACDAWPQEVLAAHGKVTVLVNNAGVALGGTFQQVAAADFDWLMEINFHAPVRLTRAFLPLLAREPAAQLVNLSSIFGIIAPPQQTAYCASKFALRGFSQSLRHELQSEGSTVGVTVVHPGGVDTAIASSARRPPDAKPQDVEMLEKAWKALPKLAPQQAARVIGDAIAQRAPRVLVGPDAKRAAFVERLAPVGYWKFIGPALARAIANN